MDRWVKFSFGKWNRWIDMSGFSISVFLVLLIKSSTAFMSWSISSRIVTSHVDMRRIYSSTSASLGSIALVGSGPGNPDLLTIQASRLLENAGEDDVLFFPSTFFFYCYLILYVILPCPFLFQRLGCSWSFSIWRFIEDNKVWSESCQQESR